MAVRQMLSLILTYVLRILVNDRADVDVSCTFVFCQDRCLQRSCSEPCRP
jgi:hypothetical protein